MIISTRVDEVDARLRDQLAELRTKDSSDLADWLLSTYQIGSPCMGEGLTLIAHLTFKRADQRRLAEHFLSGLPFANPRPYEIFLAKLPLSIFIEITEQFLPQDAGHRQLLVYHLEPLLRKSAKSERDHAVALAFLDRIAASSSYPVLD